MAPLLIKHELENMHKIIRTVTANVPGIWTHGIS